MVFSRFLSRAFLLLSTAAVSAPIATAPFRSVRLTNGGLVIVRHGASQSVEVIAGKPRIAVAADGRLTIDNRDSPHEPRATIAVTTPALDSFSVDNGGKLVLDQGFPAQAALNAHVDNGGMLDLRRLAAARVNASVEQGGIVLVRADQSLDARISQGGNVTYWGDAAVKSMVNGGGAVARGRPEDMGDPL